MAFLIVPASSSPRLAAAMAASSILGQLCRQATVRGHQLDFEALTVSHKRPLCKLGEQRCAACTHVGVQKKTASAVAPAPALAAAFCQVTRRCRGGSPCQLERCLLRQPAECCAPTSWLGLHLCASATLHASSPIIAFSTLLASSPIIAFSTSMMALSAPPSARAATASQYDPARPNQTAEATQLMLPTTSTGCAGG